MPLLNVEKEETSPDLTPQAIGLRLMQARKMTNLSRRQIEEKHQLKATTLKSWETGRYNGLTEKGGKQIVAILQTENIDCSLQWLLYGIGLGPRLQLGLSGEDIIQQELEFFQQQHNQTLHYRINSNDMAPRFVSNEIVAGIIIDKQHYANVLTQACLMRCPDQKFVIGVMCDQPSFCLKTNDETLITITDDCVLAPIVWQRRTLPV